MSCEGVDEANDDNLCIKVKYNDKNDDVLILHKVHGEDTVYEGYLLKERTRTTVVIKDPNMGPNDLEVNLFIHTYQGRKKFICSINLSFSIVPFATLFCRL